MPTDTTKLGGKAARTDGQLRLGLCGERCACWASFHSAQPTEPANVGRNKRSALRRKSIRIRESRFTTTGPIRRVYAVLDESVERRIGPVDNPIHQPVFHGIDVHVIHVGGKVCLIPKQMLPITPLPNTPLAPAPPRRGDGLSARNRFGKACLGQAPSAREVGVAGRQFNHAMQVIGQHHPAVYSKRMSLTHGPNDRPQNIDMPSEQVVAASFQRGDGKEICAARVPVATVVGHLLIIAAAMFRRNALRLLRPTFSTSSVL